MKPYVESFNLMGENVNTIRKRAATLLLADKEDRLEANYEDAAVSSTECRTKSQHEDN